jgi:glycosyltransferase involved in cell wall biosynthesis
MSRLRLALVTHLWPVPGAPHAGKPIYETALRLRDAVEIEVFCPAPRYPRARWLQPARFAYHRADPAAAPPGLPTHYLEYATLPWIGRAFNGLSTAKAIGPALAAWQPDVILSYWLYPTAWAALRVGRRLGVAVIVGSRGSDLHRIPDALVRRMTSATLRRADAVITVTEDLRRAAIRLGAAPARTHSIPNGCDPRVFHPFERADARRALGLSLDGRLLLQVGNLIASKGIFDLWNAFELLAASKPDLRLALVGEGPAEAAIRDRAMRSGLAQRLLLPGARPAVEIPLWLNAADLVCLASHGEGCPNVVIEALCCGRPVVGTDVGGIPELIGAGCGFLTPARNPPAFARAVSQALETVWEPRAIAARFSRSWEDVARETLAICSACLKHPGVKSLRQ